jgi:hypothetical protein
MDFDSSVIAVTATQAVRAIPMISTAGTPQQRGSAALLKRRLDLERQELKTASVFERYLSIGNDRSLLSKVAFEQPELSTPRNLVGSVIFGSPLKQLASIMKGLSSPAYAASSYSYGFPEYGFSTDELDDPAFDDPYANEQKVELDNHELWRTRFQTSRWKILHHDGRHEENHKYL